MFFLSTVNHQPSTFFPAIRQLNDEQGTGNEELRITPLEGSSLPSAICHPPLKILSVNHQLFPPASLP